MYRKGTRLMSCRVPSFISTVTDWKPGPISLTTHLLRERGGMGAALVTVRFCCRYERDLRLAKRLGISHFRPAPPFPLFLWITTNKSLTLAEKELDTSAGDHYTSCDSELMHTNEIFGSLVTSTDVAFLVVPSLSVPM